MMSHTPISHTPTGVRPWRVTRRLIGLAALALLALATSAPRASAQDRGVDLSPKFEKGVAWRFRYHVESEMDLSLGKDDHAMTMMKEVVVRAKVVEASDAGAKVEIVHEEVRLNSSGEMPGSFDSTKPAKNDADNVYAHILRPLVGATLTLDLDKDGTIRHVEGLDQINPGDALEAQLFHSLFGEDEFIRMYQPLFNIKPDDPKAERGQSWTVTQREGADLGMQQTDLRLTLERISRHDARIRIATAESKGGASPSGATKITGSCVWDLDQGVLRELRTESTTTFAPDSSRTNGTSVTGKARATTELEMLDSAGH